MKKHLPPVLWMVIIFALSSVPGKEFPRMPFPGFDKLVHIGLYSILGFLWARAITRRPFAAFSIGAVYGIWDECYQILVPYRHFSVLDIAANFVGVTIGVVCHLFLKRSK